MELQRAVKLFLGEQKPSTAHSYGRPLTMMRDWIGPSRDLAEIKPETMLEYFQLKVKAMNYAPATQQKHVKTVKTFFNWCVRMEFIDRSPARVIRGKKLPSAIDRSKAMTDEELVKLLEAVRFKPRDYALILFLADTGCRRGGAAGLRLQDINWDNMTAMVTEKGEKSRKVAFGDKCFKALNVWLAHRHTQHSIRGVYIFSHRGEQIKPEAVSIIIRRAAAAAKVRVLSSHSLRHRKGHQFADARIPVTLAATYLGHSDPLITYSYYYPADWESAEKAGREMMTDPEKIIQGEPDNIVKFGS